MMIITSAVRALIIATVAMLAAPDAGADVTIRFGSGHHPHFRHHGFGHHDGLAHKHRVFRKHRFAHRHGFAHRPHFSSVVVPLHRPKLFHHHRQHVVRPPVVVVPSPRVVIVEPPQPPKRAMHRDAPQCREFTQKIIVDGVEQDAFGTVCRVADGHWKIMD